MSMPFSDTSAPPVMGIDAGATLCKLASTFGNEWVTSALPAGDLDAIRDYISARAPARIVAAGGGAHRLSRLPAPAPLEQTDEFGAWLRGAPALASVEGVSLPDRYLLVSLGTGTSALLAERDKARRVGGSALGGGTLLGLGTLLLGTDRFDELAELAARGDRRRVDLLVGDIYPASAPLPRELNASSFAKLGSRAPEDLACALMGLIGENIGLICSGLARLHETQAILYCGSTLVENPSLRAVLSELAASSGHVAYFLDRGAFCGAVGAALS